MIDLKKQIESIIEDLVNNASISSILLKAQAIAFYLKDDTFSNWIKAEQNGYQNINELPEYRKIKCAIKVDVSIPFQGIYNNIDFPIDVIDDASIREIMSHIYFCDPITVLEKLGDNEKNDKLKVNAPASLYNIIGKYYNGTIAGVRKITNTSFAKATIDNVKTKLLDFFLKIEEQIDLNINFDVMANKEKIQTIMNQTIKAGVVNTGSGNISISQSEIIGGNENISISSTQKEELRNILNKIEEINKKYNNEDIGYEVSEIRRDLENPSQNPRFIKRAFNTMKGVSIGIMANELTPLIDNGIKLLSNLF